MTMRAATTMSRLIVYISAVAWFTGFGWVARGYSQQNHPGEASWSPKLESADDGEVHILPVRGNLYMLAGAGANLTVHAGNEGVLLVDTGMATMSDKVFAAIRKISSRPLRYIVNTSDRDPHAAGNASLALRGEFVPFRLPESGGGGGRVGGLNPTDRASVISYLTVYDRMSAPAGQVAAFPEQGWPDNTYSTPLKKLYFNDEPVVIMHFPGPTDGNSIIHFRFGDVIAAGDLVDLTAFPSIDVKAGGNVEDLINSLNRLIDITVPGKTSEGGTMVIPGHGRLADIADVVYYRDMVTIVRDRVQDMIDRKMNLDQVKAAGPTREYSPRYGSTTGNWTTDMFVEAVYQSLIAKKTK